MIDAIGAAVWSNLGLIVPLVGFVGVLLGVGLVLRLSRPGTESAAGWRYRDGRVEFGDLDRHDPRFRLDGLTAKAVARDMIIFAALLPVATLLAWVAQPGTMGGGLYESPWYVTALPWAGAAGYLVGLAWMIRIYRADPDCGETTWRYRS